MALAFTDGLHAGKRNVDPSRLRILCTGLVLLALAACGGGGGGSDSSGSGVSGLNVIKVTVSDRFGSAVAGAAVVSSGGTLGTDVNGVALVNADGSSRTEALTVSSPGFVDKSITAPVTPGNISEVAVTLERVSLPAGGSLSTRSGSGPVVDGARQQMSFEIELVVVDGASTPIQNLDSSAFRLMPCTPDTSNDVTDCVRGSTADTSYAALSAAPEALSTVAAGPVRPYAATLLIDQSGSIASSDPGGARLFAGKVFLGGLGDDDRALLSVFAEGAGATIPSPPLTVYGPFRDKAQAPAYFPILDSLKSQLGGNTPLYDSIDTLGLQFAADAALPTGLARAIVVFTDGADTRCGTPESCKLRRDESVRVANNNGIRLFTIGLSSGVDVAAMGDLANRTGGAFLFADSAEQLVPLYGSLGKLLSLGLPTYRLRWTIQAAAGGALLQGQTLLGKVQVQVGTQSVDVPFAVAIP